MRKRCIGMAALLLLAGLLFFTPSVPGGHVLAKTKISQRTVYLAKGDTVKLKITGTKKTVKWSTKNKKIATVSKKGKVTAKKIGTTKIQAKVGKKKFTCKVIVEKKTVNRARRLRDYVLEKGEKFETSDGGYEYLVRDRYLDDNESSISVMITARKDNKKLEFLWTERPDAPDVESVIHFTIDLINGKSSVKTGAINYGFHSEDTSDDYKISGNINTKFNGKKKGIKAKTYTYYESSFNEETNQDELNEIDETDEAVIAEKTEILSNESNNAFRGFDDYFSRVKTLKKQGISMKAIGFSKWPG